VTLLSYRQNFCPSKPTNSNIYYREYSAYGNGFWCLGIFPVYLILNSSRTMLSKIHVDDIEKHLTKCLMLAAAMLPSIVFLLAEPQSCVMYANDYKIEVCTLMFESNYIIGGHLSYVFLFYVTFGYKLDWMSSDGLLSLKGERAKQASLELAMNPAKWPTYIMTTSTTKLTHSIRFARRRHAISHIHSTVSVFPSKHALLRNLRHEELRTVRPPKVQQRESLVS